MSGRRINNLWLFHFAADFYAVVAAYYTTFLVRFHIAWGKQVFAAINRVLGVRKTGELGDMFQEFYLVSAPRIICYLTVILCVLYALSDLYPGRRFIRKRPVAWHVVVVNMVVLAIFYAYFYLQRNVFHPRSMFATVIFVNVFYCIAFRALTDRFLQFVRSRFRVDQYRAVLVGSDADADFIGELLETAHRHGIHVVDRIDFDPEKSFEGFAERVDDSVRVNNADIIISAEKRLSVAQIMRLLQLADYWNVSVKVLSDKIGVLMNLARMPVDIIGDLPLVHFEAPSSARRSAGLRRVVSMILGSVVMAASLPLMGLIALLIRLTSSGPALFTQERIGVNRKPFRMYKFRTMYDRADEVQAQMEEFNESGRGLFKIRKDPRTTAIGRLLRRFSLDELPQLINVIRGEMTIVGPRPLPRRDFEDYYEDWHYSRHGGMPGLTCLWQVSGRSNINFHNMCILDVFYLKNQGWILDFKIILRTFWVVAFAKGAY